jgi:hypothetical protein
LYFISGGPNGKYNSNENIGQIVSCDSGYVNLVINYLKLGTTGNDILTVYDGNNTSGAQLYKGSGNYTSTVWSTSMSKTSLYILFTSNGYLNYDGYEIVWYCTSGPGTIVVYPCRAGTYSNAVGASDQSTCMQCPSGTYSIAGSFTCSPCPMGSFSSLASKACTLCPQGTYSNITAASTCISCGSGMYTNSSGGISSSSCISCDVGGYCSFQTPSQTIYDRYN